MSDISTEQMLFDRVVEHARKQKRRSTSGNGCYYRAQGGTGITGITLKCFVGALIADDAYSSDLEDHTVYDKEVQAAVEKSVGVFLSHNEIELLYDLQLIHDHDTVSTWEGQLKSIATDYKLNYMGVGK